MSCAPSDAREDSDPSVLQDFRETLDPHGTWLNDSTYGRVWMPARAEVGPDFVPYVTAGHWAYGDEYVWASDYSWGWVPFHHGRWVLVVERGWAWVPGRAYAGAWVTWRVGDDYVGWAAMPPTRIWREGTAVRLAVVPPASYVFCPSHEVFAPFVSSRIVRGQAVAGLEHRTQLYTPSVVAALRGPPPSMLGIDPSRVVSPLPRDQDIYVPRHGSRATGASMGVAAPQLRSPAHGQAASKAQH